MSGRARKTWVIWSVAILFVLAVTAAFALDTRLQVSVYTVTSSSLPASFDGFRIVQISDFHSAQFGEEQADLLEKIESLQPDLIVFTGDMVTQTDMDFSPLATLLEGIDGRWPCYAVDGNHERGLPRSEYQNLKTLLSKYDVALLKDQEVMITRGTDTITLFGAEDPAYWGKDLNSYLSNHPLDLGEHDGFVLLLYHRANAFPYLSTLPVDLVLSGHLHGGLVRLPFVGGLVSPSREWFPDYTAGVYRENGTTMVVSRGLGDSVKFPRVFNRPELVLIELRHSA